VSTRVTIIDGGMGRELMRMGAPFRQPEWSALTLTEGPDFVTQAHTNFIDAGADVIISNTYAVVPFHIGEERFRTEAFELADAAGRLARVAADAAQRPVQVAGSLPPLFGSYRPDLFDDEDAPRIIDPLIGGLRAHVDVWLGETLGSIAEARQVRNALTRAGEVTRPLWISYTLDDSRRGQLRSGEPVTDAVAAGIDLGAAAVLFNCAQPEVISAAIDVAAGLAGDVIRVGGYANRFVASYVTDSEANDGTSDYRDDLDPASYCDIVAGWIASGATLVGGCCGIGPEHITAIADLVATDP
jgi:S-methylmethionine-dependent homocysteine/selenocysteine methylase